MYYCGMPLSDLKQVFFPGNNKRWLVVCICLLLELSTVSRGDHYTALGIDKSATQREIAKAYHSLAREVHPDKSDHPEAEARFVEIAEAYEVLSDPEQRRWYDKMGTGHPREAGHWNGDDVGTANFGFGGQFRMNRLIYSSMVGKEAFVRQLLKRGRDPGGAQWWDGVLSCAIVCAMALKVHNLTERQLSLRDLDEPSMFGNTALHWAAKKGFAGIARVLLEHGASPNVRLMSAPPGGNLVAGKQTPLMGAAKAGWLDVVTVLLEHGADPALVAGDGQTTAVDLACETLLAGEQEQAWYEDEIASPEQQMETVQLLLRADNGPDPHDPSCLNHFNRLDNAASPAVDAGNYNNIMDLGLFRTLLEMDPNRQVDGSNYENHLAQSAQWFEQLDVDKSGGLSAEEFGGLSAILAAVDNSKNTDGKEEL